MNRVLVIKLSSLGDIFHALPAVHCIKSGMDCSIHWLTQPEYAACVECFDDVDNVLTFPRRSFFGSFSRFARCLRERRYDLVLDMQGLLKSALSARLARAARRVGPSFAREGSSVFFRESAGPAVRDRHMVEQVMDFVRYLGLPGLESGLPVSFPRSRLNTARPRVMLVPFSRWPSKNWPLPLFAEACRSLHGKVGGTFYVSADQDCAGQATGFCGMLPGNPVNLAGRTGIPELGGILQDMDLVISADTGPLHMAAALGTPVLGLYGPTDPALTGPYGNVHQVLRAGRERCSMLPCFRRDCPMPGHPCMEKGLLPGMVVETAAGMLAASG